LSIRYRATIASNELAGNSISRASAQWNVALGTFDRASAIWAGEMSTPITRCLEAISRVAGTPLPHPTSSTREPSGRSAMNARTRASLGHGERSDSSAAYSSATRSYPRATTSPTLSLGGSLIAAVTTFARMTA
jgi:hypothetical protein